MTKVAFLAILIIILVATGLWLPDSVSISNHGYRAWTHRGIRRALSDWNHRVAYVNYLQSELNFSFNALRWLKVAVVKPLFTPTAYSSYYEFFQKYANTPTNTSVTSDLGLLNATIVDDWGTSEYLRQFLTSPAAQMYNLSYNGNLLPMSDIDVTNGGLFFQNGTRRFDAAILGFTEYVTAREYRSYQRFVATGGTLIIMDATNFLAEVLYYPQSHKACLVKGHSWAFNGTAARRDVYERWKTEDTNWVGSLSWAQIGQIYDGAKANASNAIGSALIEKFGSHIFTYYQGEEENYLTNQTNTEIIANFTKIGGDTRHLVVTYMHGFHGGLVVHFGGAGSDTITVDPSEQFFLARSVLLAAESGLKLPILTFHSNLKQGKIIFGGSRYADGVSDYFTLGDYYARASVPLGYAFGGWAASGGLTVKYPTRNPTTITVTGDGTLTANYLQIGLPLHSNLILLLGVISASGFLLSRRLRVRAHKELSS